MSFELYKRAEKINGKYKGSGRNKDWPSFQTIAENWDCNLTARLIAEKLGINVNKVYRIKKLYGLQCVKRKWGRNIMG